LTEDRIPKSYIGMFTKPKVFWTTNFEPLHFTSIALNLSSLMFYIPFQAPSDYQIVSYQVSQKRPLSCLQGQTIKNALQWFGQGTLL